MFCVVVANILANKLQTERAVFRAFGTIRLRGQQRQATSPPQYEIHTGATIRAPAALDKLSKTGTVEN